jgi:hypothetical protein
MFSDSFQNARPAAQLDVGQLIGLTLGAVARNWPRFLILSVALILLPTVCESYFFPYVATQGALSNARLWSAFVSFLQIFTFGSLFSAVVAWIVWNEENGGKPSLAHAMGAALTVVFWIVGVSILRTLAELVGLVMLFVPGVIVILALWVVTPACVVERRGVIASMRRSLDLTRGQRWRLFAMFVVIYLLAAVPGILIGVGATFAGNMLPGARSAVASWGAGLRAAWSGMIYASCAACAYVELRHIKEGVRSSDLAAVFA